MSGISSFIVFLSAIAGIGAILPLFLVFFVVLLLFRRWDIAARWGAGFVVCFAATWLIKWVTEREAIGPYFPSGHVSMAVYTFGGLAFLLLGRGKSRERLGWLALGAIGILVGISRVALSAHNWFDVIGGIAVGIACLPLIGCPRKFPSLPWQTRGALALVLLLNLLPVLEYGPILDRFLHLHMGL